MTSLHTRTRLILGTGTVGKPGNAAQVSTLAEAQEVIDIFVGRGYEEVDTARRYGRGTSEEVLSQCDIKGARISTKIPPGAHSPENIRTLFEESKKALGEHKVDILYLHGPDRTVPFEDTLRSINELYKEGQFKEFGLSNYDAWEVAEFVYIARMNKWIQPTVYQGKYNALDRSIETELIHCLRKFGIRFYAYSPLGGGLLAGTVTKPEDFDARKGTRWDLQATPWAQYLRAKALPMLPATKELQVVLDQHKIRMPEAALRWLQHHSVLEPNDGVIIGFSSTAQVLTNVTDSEGGPLPEEIVKFINEAWDKIKGSAGHYGMRL